MHYSITIQDKYCLAGTEAQRPRGLEHLFTSLEMEEKKSKKKGKNNFRKNRKEAVVEIEVEIESIVEEEIIEEPDEPEEEEDTSKQDMIDTIATQLEMTQEDVLQEYEQFYQKYPKGEISKAMFIEENMVRY